MRTILAKAFALGLFFSFSLCFLMLPSQETLNYEKILGAWDIEVVAEGEYYYLSMNLEKSEQELKGTISEQSGGFTDIPLSEIKFDGQTLSFDFTAPTPPDGLERLIKTEFKVADNRLEGTLNVVDLGVTATAIATRKEK